jgi:hypothetical protein
VQRVVYNQNVTRLCNVAAELADDPSWDERTRNYGRLLKGIGACIQDDFNYLKDIAWNAHGGIVHGMKEAHQRAKRYKAERDKWRSYAKQAKKLLAQHGIAFEPRDGSKACNE